MEEKVPAKPSVYHYHFNKDCVEATGGQFDPHSIVLPQDIEDNLRMEHLDMLALYGISLG